MNRNNTDYHVRVIQFEEPDINRELIKLKERNTKRGYYEKCHSKGQQYDANIKPSKELQNTHNLDAGALVKDLKHFETIQAYKKSINKKPNSETRICPKTQLYKKDSKEVIRNEELLKLRLKPSRSVSTSINYADLSLNKKKVVMKNVGKYIFNRNDKHLDNSNSQSNNEAKESSTSRPKSAKRVQINSDKIVGTSSTKLKCSSKHRRQSLVFSTFALCGKLKKKRSEDKTVQCGIIKCLFSESKSSPTSNINQTSSKIRPKPQVKSSWKMSDSRARRNSSLKVLLQPRKSNSTIRNKNNIRCRRVRSDIFGFRKSLRSNERFSYYIQNYGPTDETDPCECCRRKQENAKLKMVSFPSKSGKKKITITAIPSIGDIPDSCSRKSTNIMQNFVGGLKSFIGDLIPKSSRSKLSGTKLVMVNKDQQVYLRVANHPSDSITEKVQCDCARKDFNKPFKIIDEAGDRARYVHAGREKCRQPFWLKISRKILNKLKRPKTAPKNIKCYLKGKTKPRKNQCCDSRTAYKEEVSKSTILIRSFLVCLTVFAVVPYVIVATLIWIVTYPCRRKTDSCWNSFVVWMQMWHYTWRRLKRKITQPDSKKPTRSSSKSKHSKRKSNKSLPSHTLLNDSFTIADADYTTLNPVLVGNTYGKIYPDYCSPSQQRMRIVKFPQDKPDRQTTASQMICNNERYYVHPENTDDARRWSCSDVTSKKGKKKRKSKSKNTKADPYFGCYPYKGIQNIYTGSEYALNDPCSEFDYALPGECAGCFVQDQNVEQQILNSRQMQKYCRSRKEKKNSNTECSCPIGKQNSECQCKIWKNKQIDKRQNVDHLNGRKSKAECQCNLYKKNQVDTKKSIECQCHIKKDIKVQYAESSCSKSSVESKCNLKKAIKADKGAVKGPKVTCICGKSKVKCECHLKKDLKVDKCGCIGSKVTCICGKSKSECESDSKKDVNVEKCVCTTTKLQTGCQCKVPKKDTKADTCPCIYKESPKSKSKCECHLKKDFVEKCVCKTTKLKTECQCKVPKKETKGDTCPCIYKESPKSKSKCECHLKKDLTRKDKKANKKSKKQKNTNIYACPCKKQTSDCICGKLKSSSSSKSRSSECSCKKSTTECICRKKKSGCFFSHRSRSNRICPSCKKKISAKTQCFLFKDSCKKPLQKLKRECYCKNLKRWSRSSSSDLSNARCRRCNLTECRCKRKRRSAYCTNLKHDFDCLCRRRSRTMSTGSSKGSIWRRILFINAACQCKIIKKMLEKLKKKVEKDRKKEMKKIKKKNKDSAGKIKTKQNIRIKGSGDRLNELRNKDNLGGGDKVTKPSKEIITTSKRRWGGGHVKTKQIKQTTVSKTGKGSGKIETKQSKEIITTKKGVVDTKIDSKHVIKTINSGKGDVGGKQSMPYVQVQSLHSQTKYKPNRLQSSSSSEITVRSRGSSPLKRKSKCRRWLGGKKKRRSKGSCRSCRKCNSFWKFGSCKKRRADKKRRSKQRKKSGCEKKRRGKKSGRIEFPGLTRKRTFREKVRNMCVKYVSFERGLWEGGKSCNQGLGDPCSSTKKKPNYFLACFESMRNCCRMSLYVIAACLWMPLFFACCLLARVVCVFLF